MVRADGGAAIEVEVWEVPATAFGSFVDGIPAPLGIGTVTLEDGAQVKGFLCEAHAARARATSPAWEAGASSSRGDEHEQRSTDASRSAAGTRRTAATAASPSSTSS